MHGLNPVGIDAATMYIHIYIYIYINIHTYCIHIFVCFHCVVQTLSMFVNVHVRGVVCLCLLCLCVTFVSRLSENVCFTFTWRQPDKPLRVLFTFVCF